ncbi:MAG: peptidoglycan DD-metalloendopeptidase family protein [Deltaproteobacteria bacterium]|nr:peptidoglycan DD-metalloendopeptidase family protein [Deltaproteobacteria bacterium]
MDWKPPRSRRRNRTWILPLGAMGGLLILAFLVITLFRQPNTPQGSAAAQTPALTCSATTAEISTSDHDPGEKQGDTDSAPLQPDPVLTHEIASGDSLSAIFDRFEISQNTLCQIMAADESLLALDILRPGNLLTFTLDETRRLAKMELFIHPGKQVIYHRIDETSFDYEEVAIPGEWRQQVISDAIHGNFYNSAIASGLTDQEAVIITDLFKEQLNFGRDIRAGDRFQVVRNQQFVDDKFTGGSRIEGVRIIRRHRLHSAFLFEDGNYYDEKGESLARAFLRYPFKSRYRVSSHFNRTRRHPITRRIAPHNGVDFPMPVGTPIVATGDGRVTRVEKHPFAGRYVEISHGSQYTTRYLHLHRIYVKRGQAVQRGQRIALSGNSGRSTGPHLHFELHINDRPVNPLTAEIPTLVSIPKNKRQKFRERVAEIVAVMGEPEGKLAAR